MSDNELLSRLRDGDKEALSIIIERYYEVVFRFCIYMLQKESDAYDITQETFLKFIKYNRSFTYISLKGYLLTIARNLCFDYFHKGKEAVLLNENLEETQLSDKGAGILQAENSLYLMGLLGELSLEVRETVVLRIYEEMKFKDIASMMGCTTSTAKSRYRLGIQQLRKRISKEKM